MSRKILINNDLNMKLSYVSVSFTLPEDVLWFKANVNQAGFYRVNYDTETWRALVDALRANFSVFSPADRASLIDDAFTLCR
jgi:aminopeptidase N